MNPLNIRHAGWRSRFIGLPFRADVPKRSTDIALFSSFSAVLQTGIIFS
ncbi:hypothetical protein KCP76_02435 [Salmonella enterica subsp. enterica serovar Weltevreden]|nr:hypothetical protein KCP76_02435 [Salmonella enterica subsp. enterica serovar Weltevreden]